MEKKFYQGFIIGILAMLVVALGGFAVYQLTNGVGKMGEDGPYTSPTPIVTIAVGEGTPTPTPKPDAAPAYDAVWERKVSNIKSIVEEVYLWDVTEEDYQTGMLRGMLEALDDPYSCYYTKEEYASFMESASGSYCGIGSWVSQNVTTGIITIVKPFKNSPAREAGLLPKDIIYKVDGEEVTGVDINKVVSNMKGEAGTTVTLTIVREGEPDPFDVIVTRAQVEVPTIEYSMLTDKVGYIYIMEFDDVTVPQFDKAINELTDQGMEALIFDVRDNPGGLVNAVTDMLDRLLPKDQLLVYMEDKAGNKEGYYSEDKEELTIPMTVLVNGDSASASEIFAGCLQDYQKATIIGTQSFGKGIVQSIYRLFDGSAMKVTVSHYFTPSGDCIHGIGITPDVELDLDDELKKLAEVPYDEDNQIQFCIDYLEDLLLQ